MALVRTDYGLIYNTDGSLCATLLPEGGVVVAKGTENLNRDPFLEFINNVSLVGVGGARAGYLEQIPSLLYGKNAVKVICTEAGTLRLYDNSPTAQFSVGETVTLSALVSTNRLDRINNFYLAVRAGGGGTAISSSGCDKIEQIGNNLFKIYYTTTVSNADYGACGLQLPGMEPGDWYIVDAWQSERISFATPFTEGTRSAGALPYPKNLVAGKNEIAILLKLKRPLGVDTNHCYAFAMTETYDSPYFNTFALRNLKDNNHINFWTTDDSGNSNLISFTNCWNDDEEHFVVAYMCQNPAPGRHKKELYFDGKLVAWSDPVDLPDLSKIQSVNIGGWRKSMHWNSPITMFCIKPTCTPEMVATWHSLDAPFFDPREVTAAELAAKEYAEAQAELARITAEAYADGRVTEEEQARIADAQQKLQEAKQYAEQKAQEAEAAATAVANQAKQAAANAQSAADTANALLADIASDSKLTPDEKQATKKEWDIIVGEKPVIEAQATTYEITTEKTAYTSAYNALNTYITPLLQDLTTTSSITGSTFRSKFKDYYDAKTALLKKISDVAHALTQADIDASKRTIYAPGVQIDSTGAWGISGGVKQAGFGTDGKNIAGGGRVVSDAQGFRTYDKPYTDPTAVVQVEIGTDGKWMAGGGRVVSDAQGLRTYDKPYSDPTSELRLAVGDISGREWQGSPLPSGTFGLWAPDGFIAVSDVASVQINDAGGVTFTGTSWETIPGLEATLLVPVGTKLLIYLSATITTQMRTADTYATFGADFRLLLNGSVLSGTERWIQRWRAADGFPAPWQAQDNLCIVTVHEATSQTNRVTVQWQAHNNSSVAMFFRILGILALRR